jgi:hypothetical protein
MEEDQFEFWTFADLRARRIVRSRADLNRKQKLGFPKAKKFAKGRGAGAIFGVPEVKKWVSENLTTATD